LGGQPDYEIPDIPRDITVISDERLMTLTAEYVAWWNYSATALVECEIEERKAEAEVKKLEAMYMVRAPVQKGLVTVTKAGMNDDEEITKARDRELQAYALRKMTNVMYTNCERVVTNLLSRELTRRLGREPAERRMGRWQP
jgi:hypothetical protein